MKTVTDVNAFVRNAIVHRDRTLGQALKELDSAIWGQLDSTGERPLPPLFPFQGLVQSDFGVLVRGFAMVQDMEDSAGFYETTADKVFPAPIELDRENVLEEGKETAVQLESNDPLGGATQSVDAMELYLIPVPGLLYDTPHLPSRRTHDAIPFLPVHNAEPHHAQLDAPNQIAGRIRPREESELDDLELEVVDEEHARDADSVGSAGTKEDRLMYRGQTGVAPPQIREGTIAVPPTASSQAGITAALNLPHDALSTSLEGGLLAMTFCPHDSDVHGQSWTHRLNDVVEVVGYFRSDYGHPVGENADGQGVVDFFDELAELSQWKCRKLPPSLVRSFVCVATRSMGCKPLLPPPSTLSHTGLSKDKLTSLRELAIQYLSHFVKGDQLVAEYVLLQLLSRTRNRAEGTIPIGDLPIHLLLGDPQKKAGSGQSGSMEREESRSRGPDGASSLGAFSGAANRQDGITVFLERLAFGLRHINSNGTVVVTSPKDNHRRLVPRKDMEQNYLESGLLQLPRGTHLTLDLSKMNNSERKWADAFGTPQATVAAPRLINDCEFAKSSDGTAKQRASNSGHASIVSEPSVGSLLESLCHRQQLTYDYGYQSVEIKTDIQLLVVSTLAQTEIHQQGMNETDEDISASSTTTTDAQKMLLRLRRSDRLLDLPLTIPLWPSAQEAAMGDPHKVFHTETDQLRLFCAYLRQLSVAADEGSGATSAAGQSFIEQIAAEMAEEKQSFPERYNNSCLIHNNTMSMRLSLARAMALSFGDVAITKEHWDRCKDLETLRIDRCLRVCEELSRNRYN